MHLGHFTYMSNSIPFVTISSANKSYASSISVKPIRMGTLRRCPCSIKTVGLSAMNGMVTLLRPKFQFLKQFAKL